MANPRGHEDVQRVVPGWQRSESLETLQELVDLSAAVPAAVARRAGLSVSELHALKHLMGRPMGPVELARALGVTSAASSGVVDRLTARGHVERTPHPGDGRRTQVEISDSGREEVLAHLQPMFAGLAEVDAALSQEEREVVVRYLRGALAAIARLA